MKKIFALMGALFCLSGIAFADSYTADEFFEKEMDKQSQIIVPEDQHVTNKTAKVEMEYWPGTNELRMFYTCHAVAFDKGEAMNTTIAVIKDFMEQNGYFSYKYMKRDFVKYYKDEKTGFTWARYHVYITLAR